MLIKVKMLYACKALKQIKLLAIVINRSSAWDCHFLDLFLQCSGSVPPPVLEDVFFQCLTMSLEPSHNAVNFLPSRSRLVDLNSCHDATNWAGGDELDLVVVVVVVLIVLLSRGSLEGRSSL